MSGIAVISGIVCVDAPLGHSVPQGSILGSSLFSVSCCLQAQFLRNTVFCCGGGGVFFFPSSDVQIGLPLKYSLLQSDASPRGVRTSTHVNVNPPDCIDEHTRNTQRGGGGGGGEDSKVTARKRYRTW